MAAKSLIEALHDKYDQEEEDFCEIFVPKSAPKKTEHGGLVLPRELTINDSGVTHAGEERALTDLCRDVTRLDVANNHISDWQQVFKMVCHMPKLQFIHLGHNSLSGPVDHIPEALRNIHLTGLVLNGMGIQWASLVSLLQSMPSVNELHLSLNDFTSVDPCICQTKFPALKQIHINGNKLGEWTQICQLGLAFPNLHNLVMIDNPIEQIEDEELTSRAFQCLKMINISNTKLASWEQLQKLNWLPALTEVRLQDIPWLQCMEEKERRQFVISYLSCVTKLNGSPVTAEERENAERAFIRYYLDKELKPSRVHELEKKYGKLDPLAKVDLSNYGSAQMSVTFQGKSQNRSIDLGLSVQELKVSLEDFVGYPAVMTKIYLIPEQSSWSDAEELKDGGRKLFTLRLEDRDALHIDLRCQCQLCGKGDGDGDCVCCREYDEMLAKIKNTPSPMKCITQHPGFRDNCLSVWVLETAWNQYKEVVKFNHGNTHQVEPQYKKYRYVAYRQLVRWCWGAIGSWKRFPVSSCAIRAIHEAFPSTGQKQYKGFNWPQLD